MAKESTMVRQLLGVTALVLWGAAVIADDAAGTELDKLQGEWQMVSSTRDGQDVPAQTAQTITRVVKGDQYTVLRDGMEIFKGVLKVDPAKKPKAIDATRASGGQTAHGIYELQEDTQRICLAAPGKDRPTEFSAKAGSGNTLTIWKRKK
jgi:uncharacterized protein (TIGR03067 family)